VSFVFAFKACLNVCSAFGVGCCDFLPDL